MQKIYVCQSVFDADPLKVTIITESHNGEVFHDLPLLGCCLSSGIFVFFCTFTNKEFLILNIMTEVYHILFD